MSSLPSDTSPNRVEHQHTDKGYVPVYTTAVVEQPWDAYTAVDHDVWAQLFQRQRELRRVVVAVRDAGHAMRRGDEPNRGAPLETRGLA